MTICLLLTLGLLACGGQPARFDPAALVARFEAEPDVVTAEVLAFEDPVEQQAAVVALAEAWPGRTGTLCAALGEGPAAERCTRLNQRPHLWTIPVGVEDSQVLPMPSQAAVRWTGVQADPGDCSPDSSTCLVDLAHHRAAAGEVGPAGAACLALSDARLRQDCFFSSSEVVPFDAQVYASAAALCGGAGSYGEQCHNHAVQRLRADDTVPVSPERLARQAASVAAAWPSEPDFAAAAVDLFWSVAASRTLGQVDRLRIQDWATLPSAVRPHLHSAIALRTVGLEEPLETAREVLAGSRDSLPPSPHPGSPQMPGGQRWLHDTEQAPRLDRIRFFDSRGGWRPTHADPDVDLGLAVLTACALYKPPRTDVMVAVLEGDEHAVLRWGAALLLGEVQPGNPALQAARADPDPAVAHAARGTPRQTAPVPLHRR